MNHLKSNQHDCTSIQVDYNTFGVDKFTFHVLFFGTEWKDAQKHKKKRSRNNKFLFT